MWGSLRGDRKQDVVVLKGKNGWAGLDLGGALGADEGDGGPVPVPDGDGQICRHWAEAPVITAGLGVEGL